MTSATEYPDNSQAPNRRRNLLIQAGWFLAVFVLLQTLWTVSKGTNVDRLVIDTITVKTAVALINITTPSIGATASGRQIVAPGGGINISDGCEGTEALFLLLAAIIACPFAWRVRLRGILLGTLLIFSLNQIRILVLFHAYRSDRSLFEQLHHNIAPLALIAAASLFFLLWTSRHEALSNDVVAGT